MEPKLPAPNRGPEYGPNTAPRTPEYSAPMASPERALERRPEQLEQRGGVETETTSVQSVLPPVVIPQPPAVDEPASQAIAPDAPLVANDDDLIEKEWVDKAKRIVIDTKDDPYRREAEVGKLQVEYLRKRYGKELGVSD